MRLAMIALGLALLAACSSSGSSAADADPNAFVCGADTCESSTQYCYRRQAGVAPAAPILGCNALPQSCATTPTCACVMAVDQPTDCSVAVSCQDDGGRVILTCALP